MGYACRHNDDAVCLRLKSLLVPADKHATRCTHRLGLKSEVSLLSIAHADVALRIGHGEIRQIGETGTGSA